MFINHDGRRKSKRVGDEETARDVAKKIEARLVLGDVGIVEKEINTTPFLKSYAELWLNMPHDWKESTRRDYQVRFNKFILPKFGKYRVENIKRKDVKAFLDDLLTKLVPPTVREIQAMLSGLLNHAVDSELIEVNPAQGLKVMGKRRKSSEVGPLTENQAKQLLDRAKVYKKGVYYPVVLCLLRTGMRIGELQALQWGDIDFNERSIEIRRSWRHGRTTETKNRKRRRVDMTPHLAETLKALWVDQKKKALECGRPFAQWVFANSGAA